jgi:hypothetical protein
VSDRLCINRSLARIGFSLDGCRAFYFPDASGRGRERDERLQVRPKTLSLEVQALFVFACKNVPTAFACGCVLSWSSWRSGCFAVLS